ncbi:hypothetical protein NE619_00035 [Anaerovorax odorimutans]|uniref:ATPase n=1 Tax=Anaerovorax odorimutans TaxID=109327 RepID=A0ABT1RIW7_9FIRM|nr:hypothetical protein [Anaerovorax odorimutans]MCQ4635121.1 hypothetical protein [Anaerovorax odorimutans]
MLRIYGEMDTSLRQMRSLLSTYEKELQRLPRGSLSVRRQNSKSYYYCNIWSEKERQKFYLNLSQKRDRQLLKKLQRRRFIEKSLPVLKRDVAVLEQAIKKFIPYEPDRICSELSPVYQGIEKDPLLWLPTEPGLKGWAKEPYDRYMGHPQGLIHETSTGLNVRSKAESMIADALTLLGIPFRYEQMLLINGKSYAPDFTILHPKTRRLFYWEHMGKMDQPDYVLDNGQKIMDYRQAGIRAGDNLILTFEDKRHPLTMREIQDTIALHLLDG